MKVLCSNLRHFYILTCKASLKIKNPNHLASVRVEHHCVLQLLFFTFFLVNFFQDCLY